MKILVIGSGGREHAICDAFRRSPRVAQLFCANGNAGISSIAECVDVKPDDIQGLTRFASEKEIDLTFVGGETPLALGVVDSFAAQGLTALGPTQAAARLESSKAFAKDLMRRHGVPTAEYSVSMSVGSAVRELESGRFGGPDSPVVVKADGLAAGKGVVVTADRREAIAAVTEMSELVGADAASRIVLEECLTGPEVSVLMFASGEDFILMPPTRDHKRIGEGDTGPNTGGMGTITDAGLLPGDEIEEIIESIIEPTLHGCVAEGFPFRGILFLGLMMTPDGPKVLEYNVRFGDPETQAILVRLETDLVDICEAMSAGGSLESLEISWKQGSSACVVLASEGYPSKPRTGDVITGIEDAMRVPGISVFHAGTSFDAEGRLVTSGGRVLGVTGTGDDLSSSLALAYSGVSKIHFDGMQFRRDIGKTRR